MAEVSDNAYSTLLEVQALPQGTITAREAQRISEWVDIARSRENLSAAGTREVTNLTNRLREKYSTQLAARRGAPSAADAAGLNGPAGLQAASDAATRQQERNDPFIAQLNDQTRRAASAGAAGTGNS